MHPSVLRVDLCLSVMDRAMRWLVALSKPVHIWFSLRWPRWTLPATIILKMAGPDDPPDYLKNETEVYPCLRPIQGIVVPVFFGTAYCDGKEALVLSDVGGRPLYSSHIPSFTKEDFHLKLRPAVQAMQKCGYRQGDTLLSNYHLVNGKIFVVDHEMTEPIEDDEVDDWMEIDIDDMWDNLQRIQESQRHDGFRK